jgi:hypothetical protein
MTHVTLPEKICFWLLVLTWPLYFIGALYVAAPAIAWLLFLILVFSKFLDEAIRPDIIHEARTPTIVWMWWLGMTIMLIALWVGHLNWDLDISIITKSTLGWAKGWALIALFITIGAMMKIRREIIIRANNVVGFCTLLLLPILLIAPVIGLPSLVFVSPLQIIGGPGPEYFSLYLYTVDPASMATRLQFYAPWSPFAGLIGVNMALMAIEDKKPFWKICGLLSGISMVYFSKSRMSFVALFVCMALPLILPLFKKKLAWIGLAILTSSAAIFGAFISETIYDLIEQFRGARRASSRVRETIQSIALERWRSEAIWFGHGTVERGPHLVEYMPIGSHHTWYGLLFVKGTVGFFALAIPLVLHFILILQDVFRGESGRLPFAVFLNLIILTFGENLEIEVYLLWPAFVILGIHTSEMANKKRPHRVENGASAA